jgi:hypothetical protein
MNVEVIYSVNGLIGPMTDDITVPDNYTPEDVRAAVKVLLAECSVAMNKQLTLRNILLVLPPRKVG